MKRTTCDDVTGRVKAIRERLGLTQERLAALLGVSFMSVSRWENGHAKPLPAFMKALDDLEKQAAMAAKGKDKKATMKA